METHVITTTNLTRRFGETLAVDRLPLEVHAGEIFGFLGHNGAGKTTTIRLLNGVLEPTSGSARVLGLDPQTEGPALRARTGVLTETPSLDERLTGHDNLAFYADLFGVPPRDVTRRLDELLAEFELAERASEKVSGYSKGMKQRLALARALLHHPELLFLDEPTAALDPLAARHVHELIQRLTRREGHTVFLCTHNLVEAQNLCDRVGVMEHGQLVALGTPAELTRQYVRRTEVEVEVNEERADAALRLLSGLPRLISGEPQRAKGVITVTLAGHEAIPDMLQALVTNDVRVYRVVPKEIDLEQVYLALHGVTEEVR